MNKDNLPSFMDAAARIFTASAKNKDATVSATDMIEGYAGGSQFSVEDGEFTMSKQGFRQLGEHIGFPSQAIAKLGNDPGLQKTVLRHVVAESNDLMLNLRVTGNNITHVLSGEHVLLKNVNIITELQEMISSGVLPPEDEIRVGLHRVDRDGRQFSMRLLAPDVWNYNIGNGRPDPVYGSMFIRNDEKGEGSFVSGAAIARIACFNWTIGKFQMQMQHRHADIGDFNAALRQTAGLIDGYSGEIANEMKSTRDHRLQKPELVFEKVAQRLGVPAWAMGSGRTYFDQETQAESVFDVVQAVTYATQDISAPAGRRKPKWDLRETVEQNILAVAQEIISGGEDKFITTVSDVIIQLNQYDPDAEAVGFEISQRETRGREVVINQ